ncbi:hypothetical protein D3C73_453800 [compost metagenome]
MREQDAVLEEHLQESESRHRVDHMVNLMFIDLIQNNIIVNQIALLMLITREPIMPADMMLRGDKDDVHTNFSANSLKPVRKYARTLGFGELDFAHNKSYLLHSPTTFST